MYYGSTGDPIYYDSSGNSHRGTDPRQRSGTPGGSIGWYDHKGNFHSGVQPSQPQVGNSGVAYQPRGSPDPGAPGAGGAPAGPDPFTWFNEQTQDFQNALDANNDRFLNADFADVSLDRSGINEALAYNRTTMGADDPRFAAFRESQFDVLGANEQSQVAQQSDWFSRRGAGDTTASLNAQNRTRGGFYLITTVFSEQNRPGGAFAH